MRLLYVEDEADIRTAEAIGEGRDLSRRIALSGENQDEIYPVGPYL